MGYRRFVDTDGNAWEVKDQSRSTWDLEPIGGNPGPAISVQVPTYEADPFELSDRELQRLLDSARAARTRSRKSPFLD
jgi:hypothetical protein